MERDVFAFDTCPEQKTPEKYHHRHLLLSSISNCLALQEHLCHLCTFSWNGTLHVRAMFMHVCCNWATATHQS